MAKFQSPLLGYNNNVRHKGRVFHIQTEDSGVNHPHIITHLFMDGGRILKSVKRSYAEHVGADGMSETVRGLMKEQHKAMFIALRDGQFDHLVDPSAAKPSQAPGPAKPAAETAGAQQAAPPAGAPFPRAGSAPPPGASPPAASAATSDAARAGAKVPVPAESQRLDVPPSAQDLTLDFDALERSTHESTAALYRSDLPPPPKNLFAKEPGTGAYRAVEEAKSTSQPGTAATGRGNQAQGPSHGHAQTPGAARAGAPGRQPGESRYAPARPAAIFGGAPKATPHSIFGDELVSDKSLDEVILSYLAEDLEPPKRK